MTIQGSAEPPFAQVRDVLGKVLADQSGAGASFAVWHGGEWVVDLWGGHADAAHRVRWQRDTLVMPYSVTKPFAALCVLTLVDRGLVELDGPMRRYWPGLRADATVRDVLSHRAGLVVLESFGWWSEQGQYAVAFLTSHIGTHERGERLEGVVREVLGLPPL